MNDKSIYTKYTILGCGSSCGVPRPNGDWGAADPSNPKNRRLRTSLLLEQYASETEKTTIVIDTGPDFAQQMLNAKVSHIDAVLYTHQHADHTHGIDDLRSYSLAQRTLTPIYAARPTLAYLQTSFNYCFTTPEGSGYPPILKTHVIAPLQEFIIEGAGGSIKILALEQTHGNIESLAFRIGDVAYCTDVSFMPEQTKNKLKNLQSLIIGALQYKPHRSHFSVEQALAVIEELNPRRAYLTHMHNELDYVKLKAGLPKNVAPAYDGLSFIDHSL